MSASARSPEDNGIARLVVVGILLAACVLGGGASRIDAFSLLYVRPVAIGCIAALLLLPGVIDWRSIRVPLLLLGAFAGVMLLQLAPLPPSVWQALPGHGRFAEAYAALGVDAPWRPLTVAPDRTLQSLFALLVPLAMLIGVAGLPRRHKNMLVVAVIGITLLSALLALLQVTGGARSIFYLYAVTHEGSAVGLFANRNHQGALIAMTFPLLRMWTLLPARSPQFEQTRTWLALGIGLALIPVLLVTGSRAGLALGAVGLLGAALVAPIGRASLAASGPLGRFRRWIVPVLALIALGIGGLVVALGRGTAFDRFFSADEYVEELRFEALPILMRIVGDTFTFGAGFGTFDRIFRIYEPDEALSPQFFNHAHNELIEVAITGGIAALLVVLGFLIWWGARAVRAFRQSAARDRSVALARAAAIMTAIPLLHSIADYPLRTPLMAALFALGCGWLAGSAARSGRAGSHDAKA